MKFTLDENIGKKVAIFLVNLGHTVFRIREISPGIEDFEVLKLAVEKTSVVITLDKDFGYLVFKEGKLHKGIIFLRLDDETQENTIKVLTWVLSSYSEKKLTTNFVTITEKNGKFKARFNKIKVGI